MPVLEECKLAALRLKEEIERATGAKVNGESVCDPRFPGFRLMPEIKSGLEDAIALLREGKPEEAKELLESTLRRLQGQQALYLRNRGIQLLSDKIKSLMGKIPTEEIDPLYEKLNDLAEMAEGHMDLAEAGNDYMGIEAAINRAIQRKQERDADCLIKQREQKRLEAERAKRRQFCAYSSMADELAELFA